VTRIPDGYVHQRADATLLQGCGALETDVPYLIAATLEQMLGIAQMRTYRKLGLLFSGRRQPKTLPPMAAAWGPKPMTSAYALS